MALLRERGNLKKGDWSRPLPFSVIVLPLTTYYFSSLPGSAKDKSTDDPKYLSMVWNEVLPARFPVETPPHANGQAREGRFSGAIYQRRQ